MAKSKKEERQTLPFHIDFRINGFCHELVKRLHKEHPGVERSGIARIEKKDGYHIMTDIMFGEQENSTGNTEITEKGLQDITNRVFEKTPRALGEYCCRIHSHHRMGCFRSGTDEDAKQAYDDGNLNKHRSVVTAYAGDKINYKCALNIFKPAKIEFDVPVSVEKFYVEEYFAENGVDLTDYRDKKSQISEAYQTQIDLLSEGGSVSDKDVEDLIEILNVEATEENYECCRELIEEERKSGMDIYMGKLTDAMQGELEILESEYVPTFSSKIKELSDNIKKSYTNLYYNKGVKDYTDNDYSNWGRKNSKKKKKNKSHLGAGGNVVYNKNHQIIQDWDKFLDDDDI